MSKRLLVLTSATGAGHDTHASATSAWCKKIYGPNAVVKIDHTLEKSHIFYRGAVEFYNGIQRNCPWFHHVYYNIIELLETLNHGTVGFGKDYYIQLLEEIRPDAILSVHDCLNLGYFELARQVLGSQVQCATYCVEFGGGYGFSRNWVNRRADGFFARTEECAQVAIRRGVPAHAVRVAGHWAPPAFYAPDPGPVEKETGLRAMGLDPSLFTVLISTGGAGAQNHLSFLQALLPLQDRLQAIVLCGRDGGARQRIKEWTNRHPSFAVRPLSFTDEMPRLLRMASAVVARAGATTAGEALLCGCPVIFNALGGMMPQEVPTWRYFKTRGMGAVVYRAAGLTTVLRQWIENPDEYSRVLRKIKSCRHLETPESALAAIL